jgi:hypothetical protein
MQWGSIVYMRDIERLVQVIAKMRLIFDVKRRLLIYNSSGSVLAPVNASVRLVRENLKHSERSRESILSSVGQSEGDRSPYLNRLVT